MKKSLVLTIVILLIDGLCMSAQDSLSNGKAFNFPLRKYGISFGNSYEFTGLRINYADKNVKRINGLNVTFWVNKLSIEKIPNNYDAVVNGITIGVVPIAGSMKPMNIGLIGIGGKRLNGFTVGGLNIHSFDNVSGIAISGFALETANLNGISVNGIWTESSVISGFAFSGLLIGASKSVNGLAVGGLFVESEGDINGIAASLAYLGAQNYRGIGFTPGYLKSGIFKGLAIAGYNNADQFHGLSIALYNRTDELHGIQVGLLNFAGNNRKGLKLLPVINMHIRKN